MVKIALSTDERHCSELGHLQWFLGPSRNCAAMLSFDSGLIVFRISESFSIRKKYYFTLTIFRIIGYDQIVNVVLLRAGCIPELTRPIYLGSGRVFLINPFT